MNRQCNVSYPSTDWISKHMNGAVSRSTWLKDVHTGFESHVMKQSLVPLATSSYESVLVSPEVILLVETLLLQLSSSLSRPCCCSVDSCRLSVFDYSNRLIGLQEAPAQIPAANTEQLPVWDWTHLSSWLHKCTLNTQIFRSAESPPEENTVNTNWNCLIKWDVTK